MEFVHDFLDRRNECLCLSTKVSLSLKGNAEAKVDMVLEKVLTLSPHIDDNIVFKWYYKKPPLVASP